MKRIVLPLISLLFVSLITSCSLSAEVLPSTTPKPLTWQEQYNLGLHYLSDGDYEAAILAFTAAIEIDPKHPEAFIGRGDAYVGVASASTDAPQSTEFTTACSSAESDYRTALQLDKLLVAVYSKLADLFLLMGDKEAALAILEQGCEITGDEGLAQRLEELNRPEGASETVTVEGTIFLNEEVYRNEIIQIIRNSSSGADALWHPIFGIRFSNAVSMTIEGEVVSIQEAEYGYFNEAIDADTQLYHPESETRGPLLDKPLLMTGYFVKNEQTTLLSGPFEEDGRLVERYRPNGDYVFYIESYTEP